MRSSPFWASSPSIVSLPTPRWVLIRLAISSRLASTGTTVRPVATLSSSSGYRLNGSLVATTSVPFVRRMGKRASRWMNFEGKSCSKLRSTSASTRSTNSRPTSSPKRPQRRLLGEESQLDGRLVEPHSVGLGVARQFELPLVEEPLAEEHFANVHQMPSSEVEGFLWSAFTDSFARRARARTTTIIAQRGLL